MTSSIVQRVLKAQCISTKSHNLIFLFHIMKIPEMRFLIVFSIANPTAIETHHKINATSNHQKAKTIKTFTIIIETKIIFPTSSSTLTVYSVDSKESSSIFFLIFLIINLVIKYKTQKIATDEKIFIIILAQLS